MGQDRHRQRRQHIKLVWRLLCSRSRGHEALPDALVSLSLDVLGDRRQSILFRGSGPSTTGSIVWGDEQQQAMTSDGYKRPIDERRGGVCCHPAPATGTSNVLPRIRTLHSEPLSFVAR